MDAMRNHCSEGFGDKSWHEVLWWNESRTLRQAFRQNAELGPAVPGCLGHAIFRSFSRQSFVLSVVLDVDLMVPSSYADVLLLLLLHVY